MATEKAPLIYQKMANIMAKATAIGKDRTNEQQKFKFRGIDDCMNQLHRLFAEEQVFIVTSIREYDVTEKITKNGNLQFYTRVKVDFQFTTIDGSQVVYSMLGEAADTGDKGTNKALSIALKYALLQAFLIPTEEDKDPDAHTPEDAVKNTVPTKKEEIIGVIQKKAFDEAQACTTQAQLLEVYNRYPQFHNNNSFKAYFTELKNKLNNK